MTDDTFELSRRKALAALGGIGAASVGAGLGTTAFFSDEENFADNTLTAGSLDLKVDWEEHYYDGSAGGATPASDPVNADFILPALEPVAPNGTVGVMPPDDSRPIALNFTEGKDAFWNATSVEAFPDPDDNGLQGDQTDGSNFDYAPCEMGADTPEDLDPRNGLRTQNEDTIGIVGDEPQPYPLVYLEDVKPGDFGELTLSFHLCDNDGYVWFTGALQENAENGVTEAEAKDPDEDDGNGVADPSAGDSTSGELADHVLTRLWYDDDCDNQLDEEAGEMDVVIAIDTSGSISSEQQTQMLDGVQAFVDAMPDDGSIQVGTLTFGDNDVSNVQGLSVPNNVVVPGPGDISFGGNTPFPPALDIADQVVRNDPNGNARAGADKTVVVFTDGGPNYQNETYSVNGYTAPRDDTADWSATSGDTTYDNADTASATVSEGEMMETALVAESVRDETTSIATIFVGDPGSTEAMTQSAINTYGSLPAYLDDEVGSTGLNFTVSFGDLEMLALQLEESIVVGEEVFFLGTLGQALDYLESGNGIPLDGDLETAFDELHEGPGADGRDAFAAETTHCVGMEWWLPLDHANQLQTDSVAFDLGFYAEQARHNDGEGMQPETTATPTSTQT